MPALEIPDPLALARALIQRPSVTPEDAGALGVLQTALEGLGFVCERMPFEEPGAAPVDNLYARFGTGAPHFCFAGHTDVVPARDPEAWSSPPFAAETTDGALWGRGAADMKGAIAAFVAGAGAAIASGACAGSISLLITGDEEGPAINGTRKMLAALAARGEGFDHCLVGEPTNPDALGDMIKIGRRGSANFILTVTGQSGHVGYPHLARSPLPPTLTLLNALLAEPLDDGFEGFQPSNLELTTIDVGNEVENLIPGAAEARFNVRFNPNWTGASLDAHIRARLDAALASLRRDGDDPLRYDLKVRVSGEAYLTSPGPFTDLVQESVAAETGRRPELSTTGGTSDARFIRQYAEVVEFGLVGKTMHKTNEHVAIADIEALSRIYAGLLERYFAAFASAPRTSTPGASAPRAATQAGAP
ncbi:MAG: succinyl-diaminopimelate desuccinylase [Pseudomonadota bacterium]